MLVLWSSAFFKLLWLLCWFFPPPFNWPFCLCFFSWLKNTLFKVILSFYCFVTNWHKPSDLKQHPFIILIVSVGQQSGGFNWVLCFASPETKIKVAARLSSYPEAFWWRIHFHTPSGYWQNSVPCGWRTEVPASWLVISHGPLSAP